MKFKAITPVRLYENVIEQIMELIKSKPGGGRFIREVDKDTLTNTENIILNLEKSSIQTDEDIKSIPKCFFDGTAFKEYIKSEPFYEWQIIKVFGLTLVVIV